MRARTFELYAWCPDCDSNERFEVDATSVQGKKSIPHILSTHNGKIREVGPPSPPLYPQGFRSGNRINSLCSGSGKSISVALPKPKPRVRASKKRTNKIIEQLRLSVISPAKAVLDQKSQGSVVAINSNYRFLGTNERSFWNWDKLFDSIGLDLLDEINKLVKQEIGADCFAEIKTFEGYLGVTSNTSIVIKRTKKKKKGDIK